MILYSFIFLLNPFVKLLIMKNLFYVLLLLAAVIFQSCEPEEDAVPSFTINASATDIVAGQSVTFSENSLAGTTTEWTFQGGSIPSSNSKNAVVTYATPGVYNVTVLVRNGSKSTTQSITITVHRATWSFIFPGGGQDNNNRTIGDFCCTGETFTVFNQNNVPLGYAYYFNWRGQAYNLSNSSIAPNFEVLVSGTNDLKGVNARTTASVFFDQDDCVVGKIKRVRVGNLEYTVKILAITYPTGTVYANTHFWMDSLRVEVTVRWVG
jgi:PKD repeat protein